MMLNSRVDTQDVFLAIRAEQEQGGGLSVSEMCRIFSVSRAGYYAWLKAADKREDLEAGDVKRLEMILDVILRPNTRKSARGIHAALKDGYPPVIINTKAITRLMKKYNVTLPKFHSKPLRRLLNDLERGTPPVSEIVSQCAMEYGPGAILLLQTMDVPYKDATVFMATVHDLCTQQVLAYRFAESRRDQLVNKTLKWLIKYQDIAAYAPIFHPVGKDYAYGVISDILKDRQASRGIEMGSLVASVLTSGFYADMWAALKDELEECDNFQGACMAIDDYIYKHNNSYRRWNLAGLTPNDFCSYCKTGVYRRSETEQVLI